MIIIYNIKDVLVYVEKFQAVVFDLDDTLYSEKEYVQSGYREIAKYFPQFPNMEEILWKNFKNGLPSIDNTLMQLDIFSEKTKLKCLKIYREHIPSINMYEDAVFVLVALNKNLKKIGLITDGRPEGQRNKLYALNIYNLLDEIIITDELGGIEYRKPNETAFRLMSQRLHIPFNQMVYVGDNPTKDFGAPERLGMQTIFFKNPNGLYSNV